MGATVACGFSTGFVSFAFFRFLTGIGIGGEYAAINSAIDELIPARVRGRVNLAINGSFWIGAAMGALLSLVLLDERVLGPELGWRAGFLLGAVLAVGDPAGAPPRAREPALADGARPWRRGRAHVDEIEASVRARASGASSPTAAHPTHRVHAPRAAEPGRGRSRAAAALRPAQRGRAGTDGVAGVLLQRDLLHLRAGADPLLRRVRRAGRAVHPAVRRSATCSARWCSGRCSTASAGA